tara:strand:- start:280 stop:714 length:435 start_codon:yes stop_codon:yes gene_type:complete
MYFKIITASTCVFVTIFSWYFHHANQAQISELRSEINTLETQLTEANATIQKHFNFMTSVWNGVSKNSRSFAPRNHKHPIDYSTKFHEHVDYSPSSHGHGYAEGKHQHSEYTKEGHHHPQRTEEIHSHSVDNRLSLDPVSGLAD